MREDVQLSEILRRLETDEAVTVGQVADALAKRWPNGVVLLALERDAELDVSDMRYGWRGGFYATLGMVEKLRRIMLEAGAESGEDV
jgi:hypothetical protein